FALALPHANLVMAGVLSVVIGLVISSAFPAIIVYAQELVPKRVGLVSGLFFGVAFGMGGVGGAVLGHSSDVRGIEYAYSLCASLPMLGLVAVFLPDVRPSAASGRGYRPGPSRS